MKKTFATDLGKCYAKAEDGYYRLYKEGNYWTIYLVHKGDSGRLEAVRGGYISDPDNFEEGIDAIKEELYYLGLDD